MYESAYMCSAISPLDKSVQANTVFQKEVSRLRLCEMRVLKYYVENTALFEMWK